MSNGNNTYAWQRWYNTAVKHVPFLKYAGIFIVVIVILALTAVAKLNSATVLWYAGLMLPLIFLCFVFAFMANGKDKVIRVMLYILSYAIALCMAALITGFVIFVFTGRPEFYQQLLKTHALENRDTAAITAADTSHSTGAEMKPVIPGSRQPQPGIVVAKSDSTTPAGNNATQTISEVRLAILPFENVTADKQYQFLSTAIPEVLLGQISKLKGVVLLEGVLRDKVLSEINFQQGKYIDPATAARIGKMMGATKVIIGTFTINEGTIQITGRNVDVQSGTIEKKSITSVTGQFRELLKTEQSFSGKFIENLQQ